MKGKNKFKMKKLYLITFLAAIIISCGSSSGSGGIVSATPITPSTPSNPTVPGTPSVPSTPPTPSTPSEPPITLRPDAERFKYPFTPAEQSALTMIKPPVPDASNPPHMTIDGNILATENNRLGTGYTLTGDVASYSKILDIKGKKIIMKDNSIGVQMIGNDLKIDKDSLIQVGKNSIGIYGKVNRDYTGPNLPGKLNTHINFWGTIELNGDNSIGMYSSGAEMTSNGTIRSDKKNTIGIYVYSDYDITSFKYHDENDIFGDIILTGEKSIGIYGKGKGEYALHNSGRIVIGDSPDRNNPSIGMYTDEIGISLYNIVGGYEYDRMRIIVGKNSIGMMKTRGNGSSTGKFQIENDGFNVIELVGDGAIGMVLGENVWGRNRGNIRTRKKADGTNPKGVIGVLLGKNSRFVNEGWIEINSPDGVAIFNAGGTFINTGSVKVSDGAVEEIKATNPLILKNMMTPFGGESFNIYVDTLGGTNPIEGIGSIGLKKINLVMGAEAASSTNATEIAVDKKILGKYNDSFKDGTVKEVDIKSDALLWETESVTERDTVKSVILKKKSFTEFAEDSQAEKLTEGLDERYSAAPLDSQEKELFNSLNSLNTNQKDILSKTYKEISGQSQYINVQQRIKETGTMLDKEISDLQKEFSENGSKIKTFVTGGGYKSKVEEVPNHKTTGFGAVYVNNNADTKMNWYAAAGVNNFRLQDSGRSKEEVSMLKAGVSKTFTFGKDIDWTVAGEGFVARSEMERVYTVMGIGYTAQAGYNSYAVALKNEIGKNFGSDTFTIRPYASLKAEYGRFSDIKERNGVLRLHVEGDDYYSVKPELGVEFSYVQPMFTNSKFKASLGLGYDYELGKVENIENSARYVDTSSTWKFKGIKEGERGNFKADLRLGFEAGHYGITINGGYDTRNKNARVGLGIGATF